jgi:chromosome segregation ATPase
MSITSAGIYGYLSSAYSETSNKVENIDKQVKVLDTKREMFQVQLNDVRSEKERISSNISELTKAVSNNFVQSKDKRGNIITTSSSANRKVYEEQLKSSQKRRDDILLTETSLNDSITRIDLKKLDLETNTDIAGEIGPLKYIAKLTGSSMDQVINWFIIALMLVFDPLAVSLVVGANVIFRDKKKEKEKIQKSMEIDDKIKEFEQREAQFIISLRDFEERESDINNREEQFNKSILEREQEIETKEKEYLKKLDGLDEDISIFEKFSKSERNKIIKEKQDIEEKELKIKENLKDLKDKIKSDERELKEKYQDQLEDLKKEKDELKEEKKKLFKLKKEIEEDKKDVEIKEDKEIKEEEKKAEAISKQSSFESFNLSTPSSKGLESKKDDS